MNQTHKCRGETFPAGRSTKVPRYDCVRHAEAGVGRGLHFRMIIYLLFFLEVGAFLGGLV